MEFEKADSVWIPKSACVAFYLSVFLDTLQLAGFKHCRLLSSGLIRISYYGAPQATAHSNCV